MMNRPKMTWDRLLSQLNDPQITDREVIGLLSATDDVSIPHSPTLAEDDLHCANLILKYTNDTSDTGHLSPVGRHARILLARICEGVADSTSDWCNASNLALQTCYDIVVFYSEHGNTAGNDNDRKAVKKFLSDLWFEEMQTRAGHVPIRLIEKALIEVEYFDFLVKHHCFAAIPTLVVYNCNMLGWNPLCLQWQKWHCFPRIGLNQDRYLILDNEVREVLSVAKETEQFNTDLLEILDLAGQGTTASFRTLATLIAHAHSLRIKISRSRGIEFVQSLRDNTHQ